MMKTKIDENKKVSQKDMQKLMKKFGKAKKIRFWIRNQIKICVSLK